MVGVTMYILLAIIFNFHAGTSEIIKVNGFQTVIAQEYSMLTIEREADTVSHISMGAYCIVVNPSGKQFSVLDTTLEDGHCSYKTNITTADSAQWQCHIIGSEGSQKINSTIVNVQVMSHLTAIQRRVRAAHGKEVTLSCKNVDRAPLRYSKFEPPAGNPFSINSDVTAEKAILERYYFPANKSLDRGDCAVSIRKVEPEDVGRWTCGARLDDGKEHVETNVLQLKGFHTLPEEIVCVFGAVGAVTFLAALGFILKRRLSVRTQSITQEQPQPSRMRIPIITIKSPSPSNSGTHNYPTDIDHILKLKFIHTINTNNKKINYY